jgi:phage/plasmid-like protein (TIGR03299 family)
MAHNLEMENGEVAFALRGAPAWHNLANRIFTQDEEVTTQSMLEEAKLSNWNVRLSPITEYIPETFNDVSEASLVLRTNPFNGGTDVLATVGKRYKPVQNEELFQFADAIHDANSDCRWESAGSLKKGKVVFGTVDIPRTMVLDPQGANDQTKLYLIVWTSHDGSVAVQAAVTPVRVVCQNTLNLQCVMLSNHSRFATRNLLMVAFKLLVRLSVLLLVISMSLKLRRKHFSIKQSPMLNSQS